MLSVSPAAQDAFPSLYTAISPALFAPYNASTRPMYAHPQTSLQLSTAVPATPSRRSSLTSSSTTTYSPGSALPISAGSDAHLAPPLKATPQPTHIRRARTTANPYARDTASRSPSDIELDDANMNGVQYMQPQPEYASVPMYHVPQHPHQHAVVGGMSSMSLNGHGHGHMHSHGHHQQMQIPDQTLEQLALAVRSATTTSASDRAKTTFVQTWLQTNYAQYPDGNVPRQGLYMSYRRVCDDYQIPHINTATLGKAIRACFPNIKTRRLGVRGNSKYHYCGIRPTNATEAEWLQRFATTNQGWDINQLPPGSGSGRPSSSHLLSSGSSSSSHPHHSEEEEEGDESDELEDMPRSNGHAHPQTIALGKEHRHYAFDVDDRTPTTGGALLAQQQQGRPPSSAQPSPSPLSGSPRSAFAAPHLPSSVRQIQTFPSINEALGPPPPPGSPESAHAMLAREVWEWFLDHQDALLDAVRTLRFDQVEMGLRNFWNGLGDQHREVVHMPAVQGLMARADALVYDEILETLRSQILAPIPAAALHQLRLMAEKMEKILLTALDGYSPTFYEPKIELGARFGHLVTRFLDMFQVCQALRSVLASQKQMGEMRHAWTQIDFDSVRNQTALVCNCRHEVLVTLLEHDFPHILEGMLRSAEPVRDLMTWADTTYERIVSGEFGGENLDSRSVLIRWGFVTSQIMRDLTIRSDISFGAYQILKLFLDDWIALHVLRNVALSTNSVQASVDPGQYINVSPDPNVPEDPYPGAGDYMAFPPPGPTTSSTMMAALTADNAFAPDALDPASAAAAGFAFPLTSLDFSGDPSQQGVDQLMSAMSVMGSAGPYPDFATPSGSTFDVHEYTHDYGMTPSGTTAVSPPQRTPKTEPESVHSSPHSHHT